MFNADEQATYREFKEARAGAADYMAMEGDFSRYLDDVYSAEPVPREALTDECEILVVGAGFAGLMLWHKLRQAGFAAGAIQHHAILELRYRGQSFELAVPEGVDPAGRFAERHRTRYGWDLEESSAAAEVELVAIRVRSLVTADAPRVGRNPRARQVPDSARVGRRRAWFGGWKNVPRFDRERLPLGCVVEGPAIIEEFSGTTLVPPGCTARVRQGRHLWLTS